VTLLLSPFSLRQASSGVFLFFFFVPSHQTEVLHCTACTMTNEAPIEWERAFSFIAGNVTSVIDASKLVAAFARVGAHVSAEEAQQMLLALCGDSQCT